MMSVRAGIWLMTELLDCVKFSIWEGCSCMVNPFSSSALISSDCAESSACFAAILAYTSSAMLATLDC